MSRKIKLCLFTICAIILLVLCAFLVKSGLRFYCPFNLITGLNCPGCGNTRAAFALLRFDFKAMFYYNLFFPFELAFLLRVYVDCANNYIKHNRFGITSIIKWYDVLFLILMVAWTIVRNTTDLF